MTAIAATPAAGLEIRRVDDINVFRKTPHPSIGPGRTLLQHACEHARERNATIVLLASSEGQQLYSRCGFSEVARFGYWSRSFQRRTR